MQVKSIAECSFIKLPSVIKSFVLSIFEWLFYTGFILCSCCCVAVWLMCLFISVPCLFLAVPCVCGLRLWQFKATLTCICMQSIKIVNHEVVHGIFLTMCEAMSMLARVTVKSLRWRQGSIRAPHQVPCSSPCWRPLQASSTLEFPRMTSMQMILSSLLTRMRNVSGG